MDKNHPHNLNLPAPTWKPECFLWLNVLFKRKRPRSSRWVKIPKLSAERCWLQVEGACLGLGGRDSFVLHEWQQAGPWGPSSGGLTHLERWVEFALLLSSATSHTLLLLGWGLTTDAVGYKGLQWRICLRTLALFAGAKGFVASHELILTFQCPCSEMAKVALKRLPLGNQAQGFMCVLNTKSLSGVRIFVNLGTIVQQAPLSMGFPRQIYWGGLPCPPPGDLPDPGIEPTSLLSPALAGGFFTLVPSRKQVLWSWIKPLTNSIT